MFDLSLLSRAVETGIISAAQREQLLALAGEAESAGETAHPDVVRDEAPRFFRSFNDLFIGLGVVILGYALNFGATLVSGGEAGAKFIAMLAIAGIFWLLAEWITGIRRINFPSIVIALF